MRLYPDDSETIRGLGTRLRSGEINCAGIVQSSLTRIDELEPQIRAWVSVEREGSLQRAAELDAELAAGQDRGPLHGIPIGIKDIVDVAGWPTAAGSEGWKENIAAVDAALVTRLRDAGAIILGKTVTTQYASFDPPVTTNPWNSERTPGGSSSGSAAAVAAGMCPAAIGSQTGGSITRPASFCGVSGCKPTHGRVSLRGVLPLAPNLDHPGPIARTVDDLALLYETIAGYDPADPYSADRPIDAVETMQSSAPRLGRLGGLFDSTDCADVAEIGDQAVQWWREAGATVDMAALPAGFDDVLPPHYLIMAAEAAAVHEGRFRAEPQEYGPCISKLIEDGLGASITDYIRARDLQVRMKRAILECFGDRDALICPAATGPAPDRGTTGNPAFNSPWSFTGLPTVSFPIGLSSDGMPLAMQIVGRPFGEAALFQTARWLETVVRERLD